MMLFAVAVMLTVTVAFVLALWPESDPPADGSAPTRDAGAGAEPAPASLEGVLVTQLVSGEITRRQYRREMAALALRDADRHPLQVPPDGVPPGP